MSKRILVVNSHPDTRPGPFCAALTAAYVDSAKSAGHEVRRIDVAALRFGRCLAMVRRLAAAGT